MSRVFTIEDDETTANDIAVELRKRGFSVDWVNNGREGIARAMSDEYDIITLDRMLPGVDGLSIVTAIRSVGVHTPVLMVSALGDVDERIRGFDRADFIYIARDDEYQCPAGERAIYRFTGEEHGMQLRRYWSSACPQCPIKSQCTPSPYRRITRWEHESVLEGVQRQLDKTPEAMTIRRRTVEHVFGTFKHWMGYTHFLTRRLPNVGTEMSLNVLAYNIMRVLRILGFKRTMKAMRLVSA